MAGVALGQLVELLDHAGRIDHDPVRNYASNAWRQNAAWEQRQFVDFVADNDGVASVGAALITDDKIVFAGQDVDDLALGFVAPLQTDNASAGHNWTVRRCAKKGGRQRPR